MSCCCLNNCHVASKLKIILCLGFPHVHGMYFMWPSEHRPILKTCRSLLFKILLQLQPIFRPARFLIPYSNKIKSNFIYKAFIQKMLHKVLDKKIKTQNFKGRRCKSDSNTRVACVCLLSLF